YSQQMEVVDMSTTTGASSPFTLDTLPSDVIVHLISFLNGIARNNFGLACRKLHRIDRAVGKRRIGRLRFSETADKVCFSGRMDKIKKVSDCTNRCSVTASGVLTVIKSMNSRIRIGLRYSEESHHSSTKFHKGGANAN
ncbi:hypothetical protein PFISCL1PPCAC_25755, partial [Pristionchus fissidentatus]